MSENKAGTPTSVGSIARTPTPNSGNGIVQANAMIAIAASSSQLTPVTPTSNVTVTTTAAMTQPHLSTTPHPGVTPSPIPQMQVFQQPIHAPAYLQPIYNSQQLLMSAGNITLQPTAMSPSIQITPQMLAAAGKPILQGQSNYIPSNTNQTLLIGQLLSPQQSLIPQQHTKAIGDAQKVMGPATALQPKSPLLPHQQSGTAVSGAGATVLNSSQFKQISQGTTTMVSTPQLITSQPQLITSQAQLINSLQAFGQIHGGISWTTPGGIQSPALFTTAQNPIFFRGQNQDMFLQSPPPQAQPQIQPSPGMQLTKPKQRMDQIQPFLQVHPAVSVATQTAVTNTFVQTAQVPGLRPQAKQRTKAQVNRMSPGSGVVLHQKTDAANQTKLPTPTGHQSITSQTKSNNTGEAKQPVLKESVQTEANVPIMPKPPVAAAINNKTTENSEEPMEVEGSSTEEKTNDNTQSRILETELTQQLQLLPKPICGVAPTTSATTAAVITTSTTVTTSTATTATTTVTDPVKEKQQPQKAIVKPHIITHVIEGYVIQEGSEPFPVNQTSLPAENPNLKQQTEKVDDMDESPKKEKVEVELAKCEFCGKMDKKKFKRSKRFCSTLCAKRYNVSCSKRIGLFSTSFDTESSKSSNKHHGVKSRKGWRKSLSRNAAVSPVDDWQNDGESSPKEETTDSHSGVESSLSPTTPTSQKDMEVDKTEPEPVSSLPNERPLPKSPVKWTVLDVYEFIKALPGCSDYADVFRIQEIDGQALLLLTEDHLMTAMNMKLGPALKIFARINSLKEVNRQ